MAHTNFPSIKVSYNTIIHKFIIISTTPKQPFMPFSIALQPRLALIFCRYFFFLTFGKGLSKSFVTFVIINPRD